MNTLRRRWRRRRRCCARRCRRYRCFGKRPFNAHGLEWRPLQKSRRMGPLMRAHRKAMAKLLTDSEFLRFSELQQKQSSFTITPEEADELRDIVAHAQKRRDDRAAAMQSIES